MDGTSGALYAIYLNALVLAFGQQHRTDNAIASVWAAAMSQASEVLARYTPAQPGDRTLIDALYPFIETLKQTGDLKQAAEASRIGAERTKGMEASLGRTVYIGGSGYQQVPDPGAWGLSEFFLGLGGPSAKETTPPARPAAAEAVAPPAPTQPDIWTPVPLPGQAPVQQPWSSLPSYGTPSTSVANSQIAASDIYTSSEGGYYPTPDLSVSTLSVSGIGSSDTEPEYEVL